MWVYLPDVDLGEGIVSALCVGVWGGWVGSVWVGCLPDVNCGEGGVAALCLGVWVCGCVWVWVFI